MGWAVGFGCEDIINVCSEVAHVGATLRYNGKNNISIVIQSGRKAFS